MRNIGLEVMELTNITRCISASLSCSSVVMYRFFHQVDLPTKSRCKIITQSPLINHWIGGVVKLIDEIDIRIRMPLPSSHGTEQVQFIDMMPQRDRTSNLRYLLRHSDPRNHIKRFHRARTCASFFSTWRMTSSSKIPMRWPNAEVCTARIFSVITQLILIKPFCAVGGTLTRVVISSDVKEVIRHTTVESKPSISSFCTTTTGRGFLA